MLFTFSSAFQPYEPLLDPQIYQAQSPFPLFVPCVVPHISRSPHHSLPLYVILKVFYNLNDPMILSLFFWAVGVSHTITDRLLNENSVFSHNCTA